MTREEAIERYNVVRYNLLNHKDKEAVDFAFDALREQEERSKGCKYCTATYIQHGSLVGFCPYCGRRLEEV